MRSNSFQMEMMEGRRLFAAATLSLADFKNFLTEADTDSSGSVSVAEAKAEITVIKSAIAQAKSEANDSLKSAKADYNNAVKGAKSDLAGAISEAGGDRDSIAMARSDYKDAVASAKSTYDLAVADAKSGLAESLALYTPAQTFFTTLSKSIGKAFNGDTNGDKELGLTNGETENLLKRDGTAETLSAKDFANINKIPKVKA